MNAIRALTLVLALVAPAALTQSAQIEFALPTPSGQTLKLSNYRGKVVVLNFFASWCSSCWGEIPGLAKLSRDYKEKGVVVLGVGLQTSASDVKAMVAKLGMTYPVAVDVDGQVATRDLGVQGLPTTLILDKQGRVVQRLAGEIKDVKSLKPILEALR